jgi:Uma2 family endonuclease
LTFAFDDGIVVVMTTYEYLDTPETNRRRELTYSVVREPPAPFYSHQHVALLVARLLSDHVEALKLGRVGIAPIDVILDRERALVLQPDVLFIAAGRLSIIHEQIEGAPDLVVEVLSIGTESYDRREKLDWYRQYGVREYWIADPSTETLTVADFTSGAVALQTIERSGVIRSTVFPDLQATVRQLFTDRTA